MVFCFLGKNSVFNENGCPFITVIFLQKILHFLRIKEICILLFSSAGMGRQREPSVFRDPDEHIQALVFPAHLVSRREIIPSYEHLYQSVSAGILSEKHFFLHFPLIL